MSISAQRIEKLILETLTNTGEMYNSPLLKLVIKETGAERRDVASVLIKMKLKGVVQTLEAEHDKVHKLNRDL